MTNPTLQTAVLAGGCFWCLEAVFDDLGGVISVESGYAGGEVANPTYQHVCTGETGHAEVIRVTFDPALLSYRSLLNVFFAVHDPTSLNRQGNDVGTQYRSAIFYLGEEQKQIAQATLSELSQAGIWQGKLVTELTPLDTFYMAEDYHQEYFANHPNQPYCMAVVAPKVAKFKKQFVSTLPLKSAAKT